MSIPCKMRPVGLESLPLGYTRVEYLDNMGSTAHIYGVAERIKNPFEMEMVFYGGGVEWIENNFCGQMAVESNPSWWFYSYVKPGHVGFRTVPASTNKYKVVDVYLTGATRKQVATFKNGVYTAPDGSTHEFGNIRESSDPRTMQIFYEWETNKGCKISSVYVKTGEKEHHYVAALDNTGKPCMYDLVSKQPFYNAKTTGIDFIAGMTMVQALKLKNLPARTATLNVSLPEGYESQEEVMESIRQAEEKGWTLNITTHTPT